MNNPPVLRWCDVLPSDSEGSENEQNDEDDESDSNTNSTTGNNPNNPSNPSDPEPVLVTPNNRAANNNNNANEYKSPSDDTKPGESVTEEGLKGNAEVKNNGKFRKVTGEIWRERQNYLFPQSEIVIDSEVYSPDSPDSPDNPP